MTYKGFLIIPAPFIQPHGAWRLEGTIAAATDAGVGELFESQNEYPTKEAAEEHFLSFGKRYIDGSAQRSDVDEPRTPPHEA